MRQFLIYLCLLFLSARGFSQDSLQINSTLSAEQDSTVAPSEVHLDLITVKVLKVYDGDGCRARFPDGKVRKLRFSDLDAPDLKNAYVGIDSTQPFAIASRDSLRRLILGKEVRIDTLPYGKATYSYDRLLVDVYTLPLQEGEPTVYLNALIVQRGWAWATPQRRNQVRVNPFIRELIDKNFKEAKDKKQGLWYLKGRKYSPAYWRTNPFKNKRKVT